MAYNYGPLGHIQTANHLWKTIVKPGDVVIDATSGNGKDSLFLAKLAIQPSGGKLYCIDIQEEAIQQTRLNFLKDKTLSEYLDGQIKLVHANHEKFPEDISIGTASLICYNLGYLPGKPRLNSNDFVITKASSTLTSLNNALPLLKEGGLLTVTAYPGHEGGKDEALAVQYYLSGLSEKDWRVYSSIPVNRPNSPWLFNAFKIAKCGTIKLNEESL